ncbi:hypothetical protein ACWCQS_39855 [Streptomyces sp. NPDC002076]
MLTVPWSTLRSTRTRRTAGRAGRSSRNKPSAPPADLLPDPGRSITSIAKLLGVSQGTMARQRHRPQVPYDTDSPTHAKPAVDR